jgi:hypothetical protein
MWKPTRKNAINGQQAGSFSISYNDYSNKRKIRPPIGDDMTDNVPLIALLGAEGAEEKSKRNPSQQAGTRSYTHNTCKTGRR